jgi:hypothetical protein
MSMREYVSGAFYEIEPYRSEAPQDSVAFTGAPRKHPYDDGKIILILEPHDGESAIYEFRASDVVGAKDMPSHVNEEGETYGIVRLWVRRGAVGIRYEPFEVDSPIKPMCESPLVREKMTGLHRA